MNTLCIDQGNTRVKAAIFDKDGKVTTTQAALPADAVGMIESLVAQYEPAASIYCGVAGEAEDFKALMPAGKPFINLDGSTKVPIINAYQTADSLGGDRIALAVAAYSMTPHSHNLIIAAGTCVTYNFITNQRTFRGGAISPGIKMRLQAMHQFTERLPEVSDVGDIQLLGYDTESCMKSGAFYGVVAEIEGMMATFKAQYGDFNAYLTGGDTTSIGRHIKSKIFADPDMALKGLYQILRYNVPSLK